MKTIINKYLHYLSVIIFIISINAIILSEETFAQTYLSDDVEVPVFGYTHEPFTKYIFWDISEINIQNNRLDITVGLIEDGINADPNYTHANWYENAMNDNFNSEDVDLRMIYATNLSNTINGLMFAKLTTSSSKKDLIITRGNGDLEVYWNDNGELIFKRKFKANGKVATIGNFTSGDNLEDVAVIMNDTVKIYKNLGNGYLDSIPVYRLANVHASSVILAQISSYTEPYRTLNNTTSDKDEIIIKQGDSVKIFLNNNSNGTSASTIIYTGSSPSNYKDFKISDFNNDGYNDLVIVENYYGINLYKNNEGSISTTAAYSNTNSGLFDVTSVAAGDFNKDGWNDFAINGSDFTKLYLNNKSDSLFSKTPTETKSYNGINSGPATKMMIADLYNKGGLGLLFTINSDIQEENPNNYVDHLIRVNTSDTDAVPAPPYLFNRNIQVVDSLYHPKLRLFNHGDRDFLRYRIYKYNYSFYDYFLFDSTSSDQYIDTTEDLIYTLAEPVDPPEPNLFYYAVAVDNSYKVSITSDTIGYVAFAPFCPECPTGPGNFQVSTEEENLMPKQYSLSNYPNPFNPTTSIKFDIPIDNFVNIIVYNVLGMEVATLVNEFRKAGSYIVSFNGSNLSSGVYYYKIKAGSQSGAGEFEQVRKMMLIK